VRCTRSRRRLQITTQRVPITVELLVPKRRMRALAIRIVTAGNLHGLRMPIPAETVEDTAWILAAFGRNAHVIACLDELRRFLEDMRITRVTDRVSSSSVAFTGLTSLAC
jgi:hypothetical protein